MGRRVAVDFFTLDPRHDEYVMYLVEEGPWSDVQMCERLAEIEERIYGAADVAIDGHLAGEHPESIGMNVRIQVDLHDAPAEVEDLVHRVAEHIVSDAQYSVDIAKSPHVRQLRIVATRLGEGRPH
jgi:hypothetical protein